MSRPRFGLGSLLVALLIVLALGAGTVYAAIPNGSGKYFACLTKSSGVVRLINYPKVKCAKDEKLINWNAKGPQGPQGAQGPQGPQGPQGAAGPADWNAIPNIPGGFKDAVDNEGVTAVRIRTVTSTSPVTISPGGSGEDTVDCPTGFLAVGGGYRVDTFVDLYIFASSAVDADTWSVRGIKPATAVGNANLTAQVICLRAEPAGLVTAAKNSNYGPKKPKVRLPK